MSAGSSKRAEILKRLLPYINAGNYDTLEGRYFVFGTSSVWDMIADLTNLPNDREDHSFEDAASKLASDSKLHKGRDEVVGRLSLNPSPKFKTDALDELSFEQRHILHEALINMSLENHDGVGLSRTSSDVQDALDAALAEEMLGKLPKAVDRSVRLEKLDFDRIPNKDVKSYFEEAHRCYLYGFHVACAVLCRAILASASKTSATQLNKLKNSCRAEPHTSRH